MARYIGRFEVRGELGRGAQSVVYLGFDPQLQREVAIKTMHFARPDPAQNRVLLGEARTVGKMRHPNIVPIFDAGEQGGDLYLVFEYVPGKNLADFLRQSGVLSPVKALGILRPILDAVGHAHAQGIIHRDLKPSNILLDDNGTPRVMDFGIAARVDGTPDGMERINGTPAYMAPEYVQRREISACSDVFSAGVILFEMLSGQRAFVGNDVRAIMQRVANEDLVLPENATVDGNLGAILKKAVARDPALRFQSAAQFAEALENYLEPEEAPVTGSGRQATLEFLLRRMRHKSDFPALSESVSAINKIANSETESIEKLSNTILKDFALTNKLLRLVNSAYYRPAGGGSISTVSRAVIVLGFEAVRNIAITVLLFEHLQNKGNVNQLKEDFLRANLAGVLAKDIGATAKMRELEQSFICALFHSLGRLLSQFYFPEESDEIRLVMAQKECTEEAAALQVLGISFEEMGIAIARQWGFPPLIVGTMRRLPAGPVRSQVQQEDRLRVLSAFANELCDVIAQATPEARDRELKKTMARFAEAVSLDHNKIHQTVQRAVEEVADFARVIHLNMQQTTFGKQMRQFVRNGGVENAADAENSTAFADATVLGESGPPDTDDEAQPTVDAQSILTAGIQDISNTLVEGFKLNDILRIILETMYRAMGFKRVVLCIRDAKAGVMQGRFGFGPEANEVAKAFRFPLSFTPDIFHAATSKGVDLMISDIDDAKIAGRIPDWYRKAVPAHSFVLFPLNIKGNPIALIYADRDEPGGIAIPDKELQLLRTLRNQAILAIKQGS
jgi:serine/threonine protein kinase